MSWDTYIDGLLTSGKISDAAILGRKGGVWASSKGFVLSPDEQRDVISFYKSEDSPGAKPDTEGAKAPEGGMKTGTGGAKVLEGGMKTGTGGAKVLEGGMKTGTGGAKVLEGGMKTGTGGAKALDAGIKTDTDAPEAEIKTGVRLANEKYFTLTRIEDSITFRKGADGALFVLTKQAILVAIYKQPIQAQEALAVVEHYATYLKNSGY